MAKKLLKFTKKNPDILVLDVMMPKIDGFTLAKEIRLHNKKNPNIFLIAKSQPLDVLESFNNWGTD
jgi:DNA-binding response OmpR family regulator